MAKLSAEHFIYYKSKNPDAGNFYCGENEIEGQCSDYALFFVIEWNKKYPKKTAEIVVVNQEMGIKSGSYKVVKKLSDEERIAFGIKYYRHDFSQWIIPPLNNENIVLYHREIGFYQLIQTKIYEVKKHLGYNMGNKGPHVWAKIENIAVDPCWADTDNISFIGVDEI